MLRMIRLRCRGNRLDSNAGFTFVEVLAAMLFLPNHQLDRGWPFLVALVMTLLSLSTQGKSRQIEASIDVKKQPLYLVLGVAIFSLAVQFVIALPFFVFFDVVFSLSLLFILSPLYLFILIAFYLELAKAGSRVDTGYCCQLSVFVMKG